MTLQRLVLSFQGGELVVCCLYHSKGDSNPGTKGRRREVAALTRTGLPQALQRLAAALNHRRHYDFMKAYFPTDKSEP
jgi:hypothetical protein